MPSRIRALPLLLAALAVAVLPGCEDEQLAQPDQAEAGPRFESYVALGNSITAGYQSSGINGTTQEESYAVDLAAKMGTGFQIPRLRPPGCPPPLVQIFPVRERAGVPVPSGCALRAPDAPRVINNVAVPGAEVLDATNNLDEDSNANPLTTLFLGGRTQLEAALDAEPTFASVWIGNNDVLGAALAGVPEDDPDIGITSQADFEARYTALLDSLRRAGTLQGGLLIGVADVTAIPALSAGQAYLQVIPQAQSVSDAVPPNLNVAGTCAPSAAGGMGDRTLVPFQHGATLLQVASALAEQLGAAAPTITLDCAQDRTVRETIEAAFDDFPTGVPEEISEQIAGTADISLLTAAEIDQLQQAVQQYNALIEQQAGDRGYAYLDPNPLFAQNADRIPPFPELIDIPGNNFTPSQPFGPLFSLDGVHPSETTHKLIAEAAAQAINEEYEGANLPVDGN
jgi:lysophospholipase L1-like esterase